MLKKVHIYYLNYKKVVMQIQKELFDKFPEIQVVKRSPGDRLIPEWWHLRKVLLTQTKLSGKILCPLSTVCFFQFNQS